jgi:hypothetical protein
MDSGDLFKLIRKQKSTVLSLELAKINPIDIFSEKHKCTLLIYAA